MSTATRDAPISTPHQTQEPSGTNHRWLTAAVVGVVALVMGVAGGALFSSGSVGDEPGVVVVSGGEPTDRQAEMVAIVDDYIAGWQATDGDRVASYMTDDGYVEYIGSLGTYRVADGSLQERISNGPYNTLMRLGPKVVYDDRIVIFGDFQNSSVNWLSIVQFTRSGDVLITSEVINVWN